jgi:hypothetical protein
MEIRHANLIADLNLAILAALVASSVQHPFTKISDFVKRPGSILAASKKGMP